tara:strand:+ start:749 stop:940 length:192 start_codon:yes stop_codon:yes gene_type:complete
VGGEELQLGHWSTDFFLSHPVGGEELQLGHWSTDFFLSHPKGGESALLTRLSNLDSSYNRDGI